MTAVNLLEELRATGALLEGHFLLRSGLHSRQFLQCALLLQHARLASRVCGALAERVRPLSFSTVLSAALGGIPVGQELARHLDRRHIYTEKEGSRLFLGRFTISPDESLLVAEDVVTTGGAVREVMAAARRAGGRIAGIACLVDRSPEPIDFGVPFFSLLRLPIEVFPPDRLPEDLQKIPAVRP
ncbi:orotate phosphoribosyltransferase [Methylacidimicrobium cyclopophantes]|uniref:Orotate phosphoribosyltransferase n=1 Tax=Methylacidimicrobium cyclopophantes TaxID=1041766 RepID=A0A5E6MLQ5_9BACT|nr:orotate phosphoribosyltransferase [Methylacidimicrobium cyclopophantes]VVM06354.1 orotate phosphoribosyltransferase [Methylacidimicrobium cyclopophantes]